MEGSITISATEVREMVRDWMKHTFVEDGEIHIDSIESPHYTGLDIKVCFSNKPRAEMAAEAEVI